MMSLPLYSAATGFDELFEHGGRPRLAAGQISHTILSLGESELRKRQLMVESEIRSMGISFTVYDGGSNIDRQWPMDVIPRVIPAPEWARVSRGLTQRLQALNMFIDDLYSHQKVISDGILPKEVLRSSKHFLPLCFGMRPKFGVWAHIAGTDLVRDEKGEFFVLEDNLRIPSGVSYMLENRQLTKRAFPELFEEQQIQPVHGYISRLHDMLVSLAPDTEVEPNVVVMTPGIYNSAYFEHSYLAQQMGVPLVEGRDLVVDTNDCVYMRTIYGMVRVHVIYRRVSDEFLDPDAMDRSSMLGCRGLMRAWRSGKVALVNAPGAGVADDKLIYSYVPALIKYYLGEDPILPNVPTIRLTEEKSLNEVLGAMHKYVIKPVNESGGYGVIVGDRTSRAELDDCALRVRADPRNYVAQPIVQLSTAPTLCKEGIAPRHLDLRPFILSGQQSYVTRGGLTRVALVKGSLVVNSSQGGGSKDTWVVES